MSKRVIFTCTVLLLLGLGGCYDTIVAFVQGRMNINLLGLFLPVSLLLFLGLPGSRGVANWVFSINYLLLAFVVASAMFFNNVASTGAASLLGIPAMIILVAFVFSAVLMLLHWMLFSPPFDEHLSRRKRTVALPREILEQCGALDRP